MVLKDNTSKNANNVAVAWQDAGTNGWEGVSLDVGPLDDLAGAGVQPEAGTDRQEGVGRDARPLNDLTGAGAQPDTGTDGWEGVGRDMGPWTT